MIEGDAVVNLHELSVYCLYPGSKHGSQHLDLCNNTIFTWTIQFISILFI